MQDSDSGDVGFRLSPQQEWLLEAGSGGAIVQCAAWIPGALGEAALRQALAETVARHEILRTSFPKPAGMRTRTQAIHDALHPEWSTGERAGEPDLSGALAQQREQPFDLDHGPLLRVRRVAFSPHRALLLLSAHRACVDAASLLLVLHELLGAGAGSPLGEEPVQYADYAEWRHALIAGDDDAATESRAFWQAQTDGVRAPAPVLFGRPATLPAANARVVVELADDEIAELQHAAEQTRVTLAAFIEACWHALLARLADADEVSVAAWCDGRVDPDLASAVGPYTQPVLLQTRSSAGTSFAEVLDQVTRSRRRLSRRQDFARAEDLAACGRGAAAAFIDLDLEALAQPDLKVAAINPGAPVPLLLCTRSGFGRLSADIWYDPAAYSHEDADVLAEGLVAFARAAAGDPAQPLAALPVTGGARRQELRSGAQGPPPGPEATTPVHRRFEARARLAPDAPAVTGAGARMSYGELNASANRLAGMLREAGVQDGQPVGLVLERTPKLIQAILAIFKSGGAYLPLNFEHPAARLAHQLSEAGATVLLTEEHLLPHLPELPVTVICLDRDQDRINRFPAEDPDREVAPDQLAYVMYTSGSTGLPKGVAVTHGNLSNYADYMAARLTAGQEPAMRYGVVSAISTDLGNTCIFPPLISGGCVVLISPAAAMDGEAFGRELDGEPLDVLKVTPSHLSALLETDQAALVLPRRWLVVGGEALAWDLSERIGSLATGLRLLNHYGPTEATIGCCAYDVGERREDSATVPIGRPLAGVRAYVMDPSSALMPPGVPGELCIAGAGVAAGYVGRPAGPGGPFAADPFDSGRMYRTGDRVRYLRDGTIEFLGRLDDQAKIRGFRVEPGEVEAALSHHPSVRQCAVVAESDELGGTRLVAYVVGAGEVHVEDLRAFLAESVPDYMIPSAFATLAAMPFTPSGKIDRRALPGLSSPAGRSESEFVAPRDELEAEIAGIWSELLKLDQVSVFDDFFALGGHSLLATQAIMRIRRQHGEVPLRALLGAQTVAALAEAVRAAAATRA